MALKSCPECDASISDKTRACPQCGAPQYLPGDRFKYLCYAIILGVFSLLLLFFVLIPMLIALYGSVMDVIK